MGRSVLLILPPVDSPPLGKHGLLGVNSLGVGCLAETGWGGVEVVVQGGGGGGVGVRASSGDL